jgi:dimethylargininase
VDTIVADRPTQALVRNVSRSYVDHYDRRSIEIVADRADEQHLAYVRALQDAGLTVSVVESNDALPDCVFIEDTALVWGEQALIGRLWRERDGEQAAVEAVLRLSHTIVRLPPEATLDGGDVLHIEGTTYVGLSTRTNDAGADAVANFLSQFGRRVVKVPVRDCLHLKTGATYLGNGTLLAVPGWFDMRCFDITTVLDTAPGEQASANCLRIREHLIIPAGYPETGRKLQAFANQQGLHVTPLEISEFEKGDGALTCLSIIW